MQGLIDFHIDELEGMKKYPKELYFSGNLELLKKTKISIIGTRKPIQYTKTFCYNLSSALSKAGICVVSGGAMGVDAIAHNGAKPSSTIAVLPNGLEHKYPAINKNLLQSIENEGLLLSQFDSSFKATPWSFVVRNELVVALGDVLVVAEADLGSGSMRSIEFALEMQKKIYVLPHRAGESQATNMLVAQNKAEVIYDIDDFVAQFANAGIFQNSTIEDDFLNYCKTNPSYEEAILKDAEKVFEYELEGLIEIINAKICVR